MEVKKTPEANMETKRHSWLLMGFICVLACMFVAFEWTQREVKFDLSAGAKEPVYEEIMVPITRPEEKLLPPPPAAPAVAEVLTVVDDKLSVEETVVMGSEEDHTAVAVKPIYVPEEVTEVEEAPFVFVEEMPEFAGGQAALMQFLNKNMKYPAVSQENGTQGRVIVQFIIDKDGSITDPVVVRSVDPYLDKEAIRVIRMMPKWKPGMQRGKTVRVKYTLPVIFKLQ